MDAATALLDLFNGHGLEFKADAKDEEDDENVNVDVCTAMSEGSDPATTSNTSAAEAGGSSDGAGVPAADQQRRKQRQPGATLRTALFVAWLHHVLDGDQPALLAAADLLHDMHDLGVQPKRHRFSAAVLGVSASVPAMDRLASVMHDANVRARMVLRQWAKAVLPEAEAHSPPGARNHRVKMITEAGVPAYSVSSTAWTLDDAHKIVMYMHRRGAATAVGVDNLRCENPTQGGLDSLIARLKPFAAAFVTAVKQYASTKAAADAHGPIFGAPAPVLVRVPAAPAPLAAPAPAAPMIVDLCDDDDDEDVADAEVMDLSALNDEEEDFVDLT